MSLLGLLYSNVALSVNSVEAHCGRGRQEMRVLNAFLGPVSGGAEPFSGGQVHASWQAGLWGPPQGSSLGALPPQALGQLALVIPASEGGRRPWGGSKAGYVI